MSLAQLSLDSCQNIYYENVEIFSYVHSSHNTTKRVLWLHWNEILFFYPRTLEKDSANVIHIKVEITNLITNIMKIMNLLPLSVGALLTKTC